MSYAGKQVNPEQIVAQLQVLMRMAVAGAPPRLTVEQGHLIEFTIGVIQSMAAEIKSLKGEKRE